MLATEFPDLAQRLHLTTPDETQKRHGQAVAAASFPPLGARATIDASHNREDSASSLSPLMPAVVGPVSSDAASAAVRLDALTSCPPLALGACVRIEHVEGRLEALKPALGKGTYPPAAILTSSKRSSSATGVLAKSRGKRATPFRSTSVPCCGNPNASSSPQTLAPAGASKGFPFTVTVIICDAKSAGSALQTRALEIVFDTRRPTG